MAFYWIVFSILLIAAGIINQHQEDSIRVSDYATLDSISRNFLIYRSAAANYATSNPSFTGTPSDAALNLPSWYSKPSGVMAYLAAGKSYTYFTAHSISGMPALLVERTQSLAVGVNRSGVLYSPRAGQTGTVLPAQIPEGAVVAVN